MVNRNKKNRKNDKKLDLLELPDAQRVVVIREMRKKLQEEMVVAKLWQSLLGLDDLTVNGKTIYSEGKLNLAGLSLPK